VRTCIGCRGKANRSDLVRLVVNGGNVVIDERRDMPGRGAWVHPDPACLARAVERKAVGRALKVPDADASRLTLG
jgi:predicted RNA-binding protein YlxR (DUF448 family)